MRFKTGQALRSAMMKISWISNFSKDDFVKKGLPLSIKRKLSILLNFPFPPVSFSGVFFTLKCETGFVNPPHELSHFWGFLSRGAFFMENPKTDLWSQIIRILHYRKTENPKKDHLPWQRHVLVLLVKKKKTTTTTNWSSRRRQEKKHHKPRVNIRNVYISVSNRNVSRIGYTP